MLQVWLDDSGKDGVSPVFVLAGYMSSVDLWVDFADKWEAELCRVPALGRLKAAEAFGLREEFMRWNAADRDARLMKFVPIIRQFSNSGIAFVVDHNPFNEIIKMAEDAPFFTPQALSYFLALTSMLSLFKDTVGNRDSIDIVFDRDVVGRRFAEAAYTELFTRAPDLASLLARREPRFEDDEDFMPLQAADLLTHCVRAHHDPDPKYERVTKSPIFAGLREMNVAHIHVTEEQMRYWRERV